MPAVLTAVTTWASKSGTQSAYAREPIVVVMPAVGVRSLMAVGTPASGPSPGGAGAGSTTVTNAPTWLSSAPMRVR